MKMDGCDAICMVTIGPYFDRTTLRAASSSVVDFRSHWMVLIIGPLQSPEGSFAISFDLEFNENRALRRAATIAYSDQKPYIHDGCFDTSYCPLLIQNVIVAEPSGG